MSPACHRRVRGCPASRCRPPQGEIIPYKPSCLPLPQSLFPVRRLRSHQSASSQIPQSTAVENLWGHHMGFHGWRRTVKRVRGVWRHRRCRREWRAVTRLGRSANARHQADRGDRQREGVLVTTASRAEGGCQQKATVKQFSVGEYSQMITDSQFSAEGVCQQITPATVNYSRILTDDNR